MKDTCWLIVTERGVRRMVKSQTGPNWRRSPKRPALAQGEYAVLVEVEVPASAFAPRPLPTARIVVPESSLLAPDVLVEVLDPQSAAPPETEA